jgi:hypothetical protein
MHSFYFYLPFFELKSINRYVLNFFGIKKNGISRTENRVVANKPNITTAKIITTYIRVLWNRRRSPTSSKVNAIRYFMKFRFFMDRA